MDWLQHAGIPFLSSSPRVCSNSSPLSRWCHPTILPSDTPSPPAFNHSHQQGLFNESSLCIWWSKYWSFSFSISPSSEYSALISFRIDWIIGLLAVQRTLSQESSLAPQFKGINSSALSLFYCLALTSIQDYWNNHSFDYTDLCWQSDICFLVCYLGLSLLFFQGARVF